MKYVQILLILFSPLTFAASFDCNKAATKIEKLICSESELGDLDYNMGAFYKALLENPKIKSSNEDIKTTQREWLLKRNSRCEAAPNMSSCLKEVYSERLIFLTEKYIDNSGIAFYEFACDMDGNQGALNACARKKYDLAVEFYNKTLESVLKSNFSSDSGPSKEAIFKSTEYWQEYINQHCSIIRSWGGSMAPMQKHLCLMKKYKERTLEVANYPCHPAVKCEFMAP